MLEIRPVDREFYAARLRDFLPDRILDVHTHVWVGRRWTAEEEEPATRSASWPARVARENPIEDLLETYRLLLPGKSVTPLIFSNPVLRADLAALNRYAAESAARHGVPALILSHPRWSPAELEDRILEGGFLGAKSYLSYAPPYLPADEIRIFDFFPPQQLAVLDRHGWLAMLHLPRPGRLADPVNLAQLLEIEQRFARLKVIVAHVGRAYCREDVGNAFEVLAATRRMRFDISANTNEEVFSLLLRAAGPGRVLFGSDMPILRMRMRRICEDGRYINLVPRGLYGDVSADPHMREVAGGDAERLSFFLYEEIDAFRRAAERVGLTRADIEDVFCRNAAEWLSEAGGRQA